jgi:hypothetical protein
MDVRSIRVSQIFMRARDERVPRDILGKGKPPTAIGSTLMNSASIPTCAQQLVFHYLRWDFRAGGVYRTDAMCPRLVQVIVGFLAMQFQAV